MKMGQISATQIDDGFARGEAFVAVFYVRREAGCKNMLQVSVTNFGSTFTCEFET
jgi:hypothetical protein